jgi:dTDP-glucose pyrophosphorylase
MKIIIPMAGLGSRFADQGYSHPKPFINIYGEPMIKRVVDSINLPQYEHIFIARAEHIEQYDFKSIFEDINFQILPIYETTQGAAISVSMTRKLFKYDEEILIVNSDQLFRYNSKQVTEVMNTSVDGCIWCFLGDGPKWSYARVNEHGFVTEVAEKKQISRIATGGMYYWKSFYNFLDCTDAMVKANARVNNEFYVAPVYNYMQPHQKTVIRMLDGIDQLGTPEDLREYENKICLY